jgi:hypothetical protein
MGDSDSDFLYILAYDYNLYIIIEDCQENDLFDGVLP